MCETNCCGIFSSGTASDWWSTVRQCVVGKGVVKEAKPIDDDAPTQILLGVVDVHVIFSALPLFTPLHPTHVAPVLNTINPCFLSTTPAVKTPGTDGVHVCHR